MVFRGKKEKTGPEKLKEEIQQVKEEMEKHRKDKAENTLGTLVYCRVKQWPE